MLFTINVGACAAGVVLLFTTNVGACAAGVVLLFTTNVGACAAGVVLASCFALLFENLNITVKTSTLDYNGDRYLSSIINRIQAIRVFGGARTVLFTSKKH